MDVKMTIIRKRDLIRSVRNRWRGQYQREIADHTSPRHADRSRVDDALFKLNVETCSEADIDVVIGVKGWVANPCDFCDRNVDVLIELGHEPDYEARYVDICGECLQKATDILNSAQ